jgi:hypothetical protein
METQVPNSPEPGVSTLVKGIVTDIGDLIRQQIQFAKKEVQTDLRKSKEAVTALAIGAGVAFLGILFMGFMLVHLLHWIAAPPGADPSSFPLWSCYAAVGLVCLGSAAALIQAGRKKFASFNPLPDQTVETMKENVQWITNSK